MRLPSSLQTAAVEHAVNGLALVAAMGGTLMLAAWVIAGSQGVVLSLIVLGVTLLIATGLPPHLAMRLQRGVPVSPAEAPWLYSIAGRLAQRAGLEIIPQLYWLPQRRPNAVAVGTGKSAAVGLSDGLIRMLKRRELEGVLAHEVAHLAAGDTEWLRVTMGIAHVTRLTSVFGVIGCMMALLGGVATVPVWAVLFLPLAPAGVTLLQLGFSRTREFAADLRAAELTGDPVGLASALGRIHAAFRSSWGLVGRLQPSAPAWLSTHPDPQERIERLLRHVPAQRAGQSPWHGAPLWRGS